MIDGFNFSVSPCRPDKEGRFQSYACFIDLGHPLCEADRYRAIVVLMDAIMEEGFEPNVQPDRRPLPPVNGIKRIVGGHMVYANPVKHTLKIEPKELKIEPKYSADMQSLEADILNNLGDES
jgi:hypothetical protein